MKSYPLTWSSNHADEAQATEWTAYWYIIQKHEKMYDCIDYGPDCKSLEEAKWNCQRHHDSRMEEKRWELAGKAMQGFLASEPCHKGYLTSEWAMNQADSLIERMLK